MAAPFTALNRVPTPFTNLMVGRPVLATFQVTLRCNSACGYRDLPLNVCRYEMARDEKSREMPAVVRYAGEQGFLPVVDDYRLAA